MAADLSAYDTPLNDLEQQLAGLQREALELRYGAGGLPATESSSQVIHDSLLSVRQRLDRLEEILSTTIRARGRAKRAFEAAKAVADDEWDEASQRIRRARPTGDSYEGPRERYADANLATLDRKRAARAAERLYDFTRETYDVVYLAQRGLDGLRQDHLTLLRTAQFESHLER